MIYGATQWSFEKANPGKAKKLVQFFSNNLSDMDFMKNVARNKDYCYFKVGDGEHYFEESLSHKGTFNFDQWLGLNIPSVFIPTTEMLSHSKGFLAMNEKYSMPFDGTQVDIIVNASLPETKEIPKSMLGILDKISQAIDGKVVVQDQVRFINLYKGTAAVNDKFVEHDFPINEEDAIEIYSESADRLEDLESN